ncbi:MAG TPA: hypothetical protein VFE17_10280 [Candidatus Baltobacteraceae bacterium]|jgi:hypothetical protein|nr:hypothetical protein [Candidatus Baltobacteraceae bacterium]
MPQPSPDPEKLRRAHPLAVRLIEALPAGARVIEIGAGRGRNTEALQAAGMHVQAIADPDAPHFATQPESFDAALSTHAFLHGTLESAAHMIAAAARALRAGAPLYCTFASVSDARFGKGRKLGEATYAPEEGAEAGVAHVYFDRKRLVDLLEPLFTIDELTETPADTTVGRWAHADPPAGTVHWFVRACKRAG